MTPAKQVCTVAGVGPGVGIAVARAFARWDFAVALLARRQDQLDGYAGQIASEGGIARGYACDLGDADRIPSVFRTIESDLGPTRVLIYNAALWRETPAMEIEPAVFQRDLALSVTGAVACAQAVYPAMKSAGGGTILFTGGGLALAPQYGKSVPSLTAGKSALRGLAFAMAEELRADNIHVAMVTIAGQVAPGGSFDPQLIAERYWQLHSETRPDWTVETIYKGN